MDVFNHHMMVLARDSRGYTQTDLATILSVQQGTISKYESGINPPPDDFVHALSQALKYTKEFFFETGRPYGLPPFHYRKRKKLSKKALNKIIAEINIRRIHIKILNRSYDFSTNAYIPEIDRDEYIAGAKKPFAIEDVAMQVRDTWMLGDQPIENVVRLIEDMGGIIVPCDFGTDLIDAVSQRIDGMPILFFVNASAPMDRLRHTLCHELGHMILHTSIILDEDVMENEADDFAGAFLLPARVVRSQLRQFNLRQLSNMKKHWKVSMGAIAVRADRLNLITPYQRKSFWIQMGKLGYRTREPNEPPREYPRILRDMIAYHRNKLGYSKTELAKLLFLHPDEFDRMYGSALIGSSDEGAANKKGHLRVIK